MAQASSSGYLTRLHRLLIEHFNLEELRTLCFDLDVNYDDLGGEGITAKARDLITVMLRQNRLVELTYKLQILRPNDDWPNVEALSPDERLDWTTATEMQSAADYLTAVRHYCASLPYLSLHDIRSSKSLHEVYVPLKARPQPRKDKATAERQNPDEERARHELERGGPLSISEVMRRHDQPHVLILGEPGAGKSTLLRQMAERAWDTPDKIGLDAPCLPILVPLRRLAELDGSLEERLRRALTGELALAQDLPQGFFTRWRDQTGANWLLLLDALDEVPTDQRPRLMDWLGRILKTIGTNRVVVTSRPSGYTQGELDDNLFGHYDLLSFTPEQTGEFVLRWFDHDQAKANKFLQELDRMQVGDLRGTPLLLTIAAEVYLERGALPERRTGLYEQFIDIWLGEAEQRGLRDELGERVCSVAKFVLARFALAMTEWSLFDGSEKTLAQVAAAYLRDALRLSMEEVEADSHRLVQVMARRSGVFACRGNVYYFVHPSFREYLAACAVIQECGQDLGRVWRRAVSHWTDEYWQGVVLYTLCVLSDDRDVTWLLYRIWIQGQLRQISLVWDEGAYFAGTALAERVRVAESLGDRIIDELLGRIHLGWLRDQRAILILGRLRGYPHLIDKLLALTHDENEDVRVRAAEILGRLGRVNEAASVLITLAHDPKVFPEARAEAVAALSELQQADAVTPIIVAFVRDDELGKRMRFVVAEALSRLGGAGGALALSRVEGQLEERLRATREQDRSWRRILPALGRDQDEVVVKWIHLLSTETLGTPEQADRAALFWSALVSDESLDVDVRVSAAGVLWRLGHVDDLRAWVRSEKAEEWGRVRAVEALSDLGMVNDLVALARDEKLNGTVRARAAVALGQLGRINESLPTLLALASDEKVRWVIRKFATEALGRSADARVLPELERIVRDDKDLMLRQIAQRAIVQICQRMERNHNDTRTTVPRQD